MSTNSKLGSFYNAEKLIITFATNIINDEILMKYLVYDDCTVDPLTKDTIANPSEYLLKRVFYIPRKVETEEKQGSLILLEISDITRIPNDHMFKNVSLKVDVISHIDKWGITGAKIRPLQIMQRIENTFHHLDAEESLKKIALYDTKKITYNENFKGYRMFFSATVRTSKTC